MGAGDIIPIRRDVSEMNASKGNASGELCPTCNEVHRGCVGHSIRCSAAECDWSGGNTEIGAPCVRCGEPNIIRACRKYAIKGATVCGTHGASIKRVSQKAMVNVITANERLGLETWERVSDPYSVLAENAGELQALKNRLRELANERELVATAGQHGVQVDPILEAYFSALERCNKLILGMSRLDLDAKIAALHAKISSDTADLIRACIMIALGSVESLSDDDKLTILRVLGEEMRQREHAELPASD